MRSWQVRVTGLEFARMHVRVCVELACACMHVCAFDESHNALCVDEPLLTSVVEGYIQVQSRHSSSALLPLVLLLVLSACLSTSFTMLRNVNACYRLTSMGAEPFC